MESLVDRGHEVCCLVRSNSVVEPLRALGVELLVGSLDDPAAVRRGVERADVVYHVAGLTAAASRAELLRVNAEMTSAVAYACAQRLSPPVLVLVSSVAAAGPVRRGAVRREIDAARPASNYGRSKRAGELAARAWAHAVPTTIVRPGIVFGRRDRALLPAFQSIYRLGIHVVPTWDPPPLSWICVEDLVQILGLAYTRGERLATPGDGADAPAPVSISQSMASIRRTPHSAVLSGGPAGGDICSSCRCRTPIPGRSRRPPNSSCSGSASQHYVGIDKMREATATSWACSSAALQTSLQFTPRPLPTGIQATTQWYQEHGWL